MDDDRLENHHVIVTGAAKGIGRGIASRIARAGADVTIFDVDTTTASETAEIVRDHGSRANVVEVDVSDQAAVDDGLAAAIDALGPIHGVVNNAGVQRAVPVLESSEADWDFHQAVNSKGTFFVAKGVATHMIDADIEGSIVNIASTAAERPFAGQGAYAASKAGVVAFTKVLAKELGEHGITVNAINPGTVDTPMVQSWLAEHAEQGDATEEELLEMALDEHIIHRIGQPEEIGHVVTLLLSEEGDWITGEAINVDAGYTSK